MIFIDRFDSVSELRGKKRTYENIKKLVLERGRFSVFDVETNRDGAFFDRLCKDPDIEIYKKAYPWTYVRKITNQFSWQKDLPDPCKYGELCSPSSRKCDETCPLFKNWGC